MTAYERARRRRLGYLLGYYVIAPLIVAVITLALVVSVAQMIGWSL
jgi:uncharacterized membrane protein